MEAPFIIFLIIGGFIIWTAVGGGTPNIGIIIVLGVVTAVAFGVIGAFDYRMRRMGYPLALAFVIMAILMYPLFTKIMTGQEVTSITDMFTITPGPSAVPSTQMTITGTNSGSEGTMLVPNITVYHLKDNYTAPNYTLNIDELNTNNELGLDILKT